MNVIDKWYDLNEVQKIIGFHVDTIRKKIRKGELTEFKQESGKYLISEYEFNRLLRLRNDLNLQPNSSDLCEEKEWYSITEFVNIVSFSRATILKHIKEHKLTIIIKSGKKYLVHKSEIEKYILLKKAIDNKYTQDNEGTQDDYITTQEFSDRTGISSKQVTKLIRNGVIKRYKRLSQYYLIHRDEVDVYLNHKKSLELEYMCQIDAINSQQFPFLSGYRIGHYARNGVFEGVIYTKRGCYIPIKELQKYNVLLKESYTFNEVMSVLKINKNDLTYLNDNKILKGMSVNEYLIYFKKEEVNDLKLVFDQSYSFNELCKVFNISIEIFQGIISSLLLKVLTIDNKRSILLNNDVEKIIIFRDKYYTTLEIGEKYKIEAAVIRRLINNQDILAELIDNRYFRIVKKDADAFFESIQGVKTIYFNTDNLREYFDKMLIIFERDSYVKENILLYSVFFKGKLKKSKAKNKKQLVSRLLSCYEKIFLRMEKEVTSLTNDEIKSISVNNQAVSKTDIETMLQFLKYVKEKRSCNYESDFSMIAIRDTKSNSDEIYSEEEWVKFCVYVNDISNHLRNSIASYRYAEAWLYILFHFSMAWRKSDFSEVIAPNIGLIGITDFEWFANNCLTLEQSQIIIDDMRLKNKELKASKNHLTVKMILLLIEPIATATVICELHKNKLALEKKEVFAHVVSDYYVDKVLENLGIKFKSKKMNKSLLTYSFASAVQSGKKPVLAYQLQSHSRSHQTYVDRPNDITKVYLATTNTDVHFTELSFHLFERGFFGWQIDLMLNILFNGENFKLNHKTEAIMELSEELSPSMVEGISTFVHTRYEQTEELLKELLILPKEKLFEKLKKISEYKTPSLLENSQCFKEIKNCPYKPVQNCWGCKYLLPTNYLLEVLKYRLTEVIDLLEETSVSDKIKRCKYTRIIFQLMELLMEFRKSYNEFDPNYIRSFIDLDNLKKKFLILETEKFYFLKGDKFIE